MISLTTLGEKKLRAVDRMLLMIEGNVSAPNSGATQANAPRIPSNSGGVERQVQKPASADSEKIESSHDFASVLLLMCQMWWREVLRVSAVIPSSITEDRSRRGMSRASFTDLAGAHLEDGRQFHQFRLVLIGVVLAEEQLSSGG
jgi:hypothetical protein